MNEQLTGLLGKKMAQVSVKSLICAKKAKEKLSSVINSELLVLSLTLTAVSANIDLISSLVNQTFTEYLSVNSC